MIGKDPSGHDRPVLHDHLAWARLPPCSSRCSLPGRADPFVSAAAPPVRGALPCPGPEQRRTTSIRPASRPVGDGQEPMTQTEVEQAGTGGRADRYDVEAIQER